MHSVLPFDTCVHLGNHHHSQSEHIHHPQQLPCPLLIPPSCPSSAPTSCLQATTDRQTSPPRPNPSRAPLTRALFSTRPHPCARKTWTGTSKVSNNPRMALASLKRPAWKNSRLQKQRTVCCSQHLRKVGEKPSFRNCRQADTAGLIVPTLTNPWSFFPFLTLRSPCPPPPDCPPPPFKMPSRPYKSELSSADAGLFSLFQYLLLTKICPYYLNE